VSKPFFLFWAPHIAHEPLEVPQAFLDKFAFIDTRPRQFYMAMVSQGAANFTRSQALKALIDSAATVQDVDAINWGTPV
jgi:hypothetical protein